MRIVSLLPAATEMVVALGGQAELVGRSHVCDYPSEILALPSCTDSALDEARSSAEIDQEVRERLEQGLSLFAVDFALLQRLQPELVITQDLCRVCAVSTAQLEQDLATWLQQDVQVVSLNSSDLGAIWHDLRNLAQVMGRSEAGDRLIFRLQQRMAAIASQALAEPRRLVCLEWLDPLMTTGHWLPELVEMAGGEELLGRLGKPSTPLDWAGLQAADPDLLLLMPCGFDLARTTKELQVLQNRPEWQQLRAVQAGEVYAVDARQYFTRPGPRLVESLEILAEILHPALFDYGHRGRAWRKINTL